MKSGKIEPEQHIAGQVEARELSRAHNSSRDQGSLEILVTFGFSVTVFELLHQRSVASVDQTIRPTEF